MVKINFEKPNEDRNPVNTVCFRLSKWNVTLFNRWFLWKLWKFVKKTLNTYMLIIEKMQTSEEKVRSVLVFYVFFEAYGAPSCRHLKL